MDSTINVAIKVSVAVVLAQLVSLLFNMINLPSCPYNLILIPVIMIIGNGLREKFSNSNWIKYIIF